MWSSSACRSACPATRDPPPRLPGAESADPRYAGRRADRDVRRAAQHRHRRAGADRGGRARAGRPPGHRQGRRGRDPAGVPRPPGCRRRPDEAVPRDERGASGAATSTTSTTSTCSTPTTGTRTRGTTRSASPRSSSSARQTRTAKWVGYGALLLVNLLIIGGGLYGWWYIRQANAPGAVGGPVEFTIAEGETLGQVSERLEDEGFVENAAFFRDYVGDHGGLEIVPGLYRIPTGDHVGNVLAVLRTPPERDVHRASPSRRASRCSRWRNRLAAELPNLRRRGVPRRGAATRRSRRCSARPARRASEGLLFPATYRVYNADSERQVVDPDDRADGAGRAAGGDRAPASVGVQPTYTPYQILIIASMIEREAKTEEDRPLIARVIYNRLAMIPGATADRRHA